MFLNYDKESTRLIVHSLISLQVRNNILNERQDLLSVSFLPNLRELLVGGKQRSLIFKNADEVLRIFEFCVTIETIDGRSKLHWLAESTEALNIAPPIPIPTPRFDRASRLWQSRLTERADEENKRNEEMYLETRKADSQEMMVKHQREQSRIAALSRGLRAISMHAAMQIFNKRYQQKYEKKLFNAMILNEEEKKNLVLERSCLESDKEIEVTKRIEMEQCRESERSYLREMVEGMQAEHCSDLEKAVLAAKGFYSLQMHAMKGAAVQALQRSEAARVCVQEKYDALQATLAERIREAEIKVDVEAESRKAEQRQAALLLETRHATEKGLIALKGRAFSFLHLHARVSRERRLSDERDAKSSAVLASERKCFEDSQGQLRRDLETSQQATEGRDLAFALAVAEHAHCLKHRDDEITSLQNQLLGAREEMKIMVEGAALLRLTDERLTTAKATDSALISDLRQAIVEKEDAYAVREGDALRMLEKQKQEHGLLKESHTSLRRKAERAVTRLNSVHNAFLEAVQDRDQLARTLDDLNVEKTEREFTIVELGSCVRQLQTALRSLSLRLPVTQAKAQVSHAVMASLEKSMRSAEDGCDIKEHLNTDRDDVIMRYCTTGRSRGRGGCRNGDGDDGDGDDESSIPGVLNESTDFLNRSSFRSAKGSGGGNSGRSDSPGPMGDCAGSRSASNSAQISTRIDSAACISERNISHNVDGEQVRDMLGQQVTVLADGSLSAQTVSAGRGIMHCSPGLHINTLHAQLEQRSLALVEAGCQRLPPF